MAQILSCQEMYQSMEVAAEVLKPAENIKMVLLSY